MSFSTIDANRFGRLDSDADTVAVDVHNGDSDTPGNNDRFSDLAREHRMLRLLFPNLLFKFVRR